MLLVILGEDASRYVGASWAQNVDEDAFVKGIYAGVSANYDSAATRDTACLLIYNAMLCPKVADASLEGDQRYVLDSLMNPMSYLEIRFGLTRYTATLQRQRMRRSDERRQYAFRRDEQAGRSQGVRYLYGSQPAWPER